MNKRRNSPVPLNCDVLPEPALPPAARGRSFAEVVSAQTDELKKCNDNLKKNKRGDVGSKLNPSALAFKAQPVSLKGSSSTRHNHRHRVFGTKQLSRDDSSGGFVSGRPTRTLDIFVGRCKKETKIDNITDYCVKNDII